MTYTIYCSFCQKPFEAPSAVCPHCGGPVELERGTRMGRVGASVSVANDDGLDVAFSEADDGFEVVPVGTDDASLFAPDTPAKAKPQPPPFPNKKIARA